MARNGKAACDRKKKWNFVNDINWLFDFAFLSASSNESIRDDLEENGRKIMIIV